MASDPSSPGETVLDLTTGSTTTLAAARACLPRLALVHLRGEVRHFGYDLSGAVPKPLDYRATVAGARVWIAEIPASRALGLKSDSLGRWDLWILKRAADTLEASFVYEKDFHPASVETAVFGAPLPDGWNVARGKANTVRIADRDLLDLGMQFPDELYLSWSRKRLEGQISALVGAPYAISNVAVVTVGKTWASLFSDSLPHGDPGARTTILPALANPLQGPIYFDRRVQPDPTLTATSVDGGVLYDNLPVGTQRITAVKAGVVYPVVRFEIQDDIHFYVASPPHSLQGSNASAAGAD